MMSSVSPTSTPAAQQEDELWYKDAIVYQLHVKAFADSNGDGVGDFAGLSQRLDYLQELGVTTLWLLPFYQAPVATTVTTSPTTAISIRHLAP